MLINIKCCFLILQLLAHEIGHNLGMLHDFDVEHAGKGCDGQGFMSYGTHPNEWSNCSVSDFNAHYQSLISSSSFNWCLPSMYIDFTSVF